MFVLTYRFTDHSAVRIIVTKYCYLKGVEEERLLLKRYSKENKGERGTVKRIRERERERKRERERREREIKTAKTCFNDM